MKRCYELAVQAGKKGFDTFGAVLVHDGEIIEEAENTADWEKGIFGHAEFNLVHRCANRYSDTVLKESTLYASCAPCERCLCAIASLGVEKVVFGVSYEAFSRLTPGDAVPLDREGLLRKLGIQMKLTGPVLEDDGMHVFEWWGGEYRPLEELIAEIAEIKGADKSKEKQVFLRAVTNWQSGQERKVSTPSALYLFITGRSLRKRKTRRTGTGAFSAMRNSTWSTNARTGIPIRC